MEYKKPDSATLKLRLKIQDLWHKGAKGKLKKKADYIREDMLARIKAAKIKENKGK